MLLAGVVGGGCTGGADSPCAPPSCPAGTRPVALSASKNAIDVSTYASPRTWSGGIGYKTFGERSCQVACVATQACPAGTFPVITQNCFTCGQVVGDGVKQGACRTSESSKSWGQCRYGQESDRRALCEDGEPTSCEQLGRMYEYGEGVKQDYARAEGFYTQSCSFRKLLLEKELDGIRRSLEARSQNYRSLSDQVHDYYREELERRKFPLEQGIIDARNCATAVSANAKRPEIQAKKMACCDGFGRTACGLVPGTNRTAGTKCYCGQFQEWEGLVCEYR